MPKLYPCYCLNYSRVNKPRSTVYAHRKKTGPKTLKATDVRCSCSVCILCSTEQWMSKRKQKAYLKLDRKRALELPIPEDAREDANTKDSKSDPDIPMARVEDSSKEDVSIDNNNNDHNDDFTFDDFNEPVTAREKRPQRGSIMSIYNLEYKTKERR